MLGAAVDVQDIGLIVRKFVVAIWKPVRTLAEDTCQHGSVPWFSWITITISEYAFCH